MPDLAELDKRSRELADTARRVLVAVNTGGVGASFAMAGSLAGHKINPGWATLPAGLFILGLVVVALSLLLAKYREVKRRDAAVANQPEPDFTNWYWRSMTWDALALGTFILGCIAGLWRLSGLVVPA